MAHIAYMTIKGEKQGIISSGCNTKDSMGNKYQETHTDEITWRHNVSGTMGYDNWDQGGWLK
ncbi:hypothetical protein [Vibrio spartinae]|uniref:Major exported protein n=1 Tax=Vibrio spartinae TaxID=1918945 RepID=A0A1N6M7T9_9VIBR|nr:hypothetical protein [Vibrio spartinae]SIO95484.1 Major exported protein [Vibrio spartinae]